ALAVCLSISCPTCSCPTCSCPICLRPPKHKTKAPTYSLGFAQAGKPASTLRNHALDRMAQIVILQRQRAYALAGGGKDGVAKSRRQGRYRRPADAAPKAAARHDDGFNLRRIRQPQHFVRIEICLFGAAVLDCDLAV